MDSGKDKTRVGAEDHAARVLEERNRAFRVLYDTVLEVEGGSSEQVYAVLCRNLRRIAGARIATLSSFNAKDRSLTLEIVDTAEDEPRCPAGPTMRPSVRLSDEVVEELLERQVRSCVRHEDCVIEKLCENTSTLQADPPRGTSFCVSCVREGELIAVGKLILAPGARLRMKDMVDTYLGLAATILQRINAIRALRESEEKYRDVVERASDGIAIVQDECIRYANPRLTQITGFAAVDLIGRRAVELIASAEVPRAAVSHERWWAADAAPAVFQTTLRNSTDGRTDVEFNVGTIHYGNRPARLVIIRDITERRQAEIRLQRQTELLRNKNRLLEAQQRQLEQQKSELEAANEALGCAKAAAETASRSKSEFLANMSHEIRTPMTAILGFTDVLHDEVSCCELCESHVACARRRRSAECLDIVRRNGAFLLEIINDILDLSKIEAAKLVVERTPCSPIEIVAEISTLVGVRYQEKQLPFELEYEGAIPETIQSDPTRLRQILINVVGNAIKFTDAGGIRLITRYIDAHTGGPRLEFDVVDTGIGMDADEVANVFNPFTQADASTTRRFGGTGLGLAICKRLANVLGGDVHIVETMTGVGTRVRVAIDPGPLNGVKMITNPQRLVTSATGDAKPTQLPKAQPLNGVRVLLAEDGPDNQRLIDHVLGRAGADVTVVENGRAAVDAALEAKDAGAPFDVILMDMQMPIIDGYEATRRLRAALYTNPIIALTAHAMATDEEKCLQAGCDDYVAKPIDQSQLAATIQRHLPTTARR